MDFVTMHVMSSHPSAQHELGLKTLLGAVTNVDPAKLASVAGYKDRLDALSAMVFGDLFYDWMAGPVAPSRLDPQLTVGLMTGMKEIIVDRERARSLDVRMQLIDDLKAYQEFFALRALDEIRSELATMKAAAMGDAALEYTELIHRIDGHLNPYFNAR
jgi:hypothetical protein